MAASPKGLLLSSDEEQDAVEAIDKALRKWMRMEAKVATWHAAQIASAGTVTKGLYLERARSGIPSLAYALGVPEWVFHDLDEQFHYYDFSGDGALQMSESRKLVKNLLRQRLQALSGDEIEIDEVPYAEPYEQGYMVVRELGCGGQGTAYEATNSKGEMVMLKFFDKATGTASLGDVLDEMTTMQKFKNKHIARVLEVFQDSKYMYLVGDVYTGGDWSTLGAHVHYAGVTMSGKWWRTIFKEALQGLNYLHNQGQMHCDIKEPNIMFANKDYDKPSVVLIDFGLSRGFSREQEQIKVCGTPGYIPPETWQNKLWHPLGDVFSLGVVMFQLITGSVPSKDYPGVFVEGATNYREIKEFTLTRPLPFSKFPESFPRLRHLVDEMTEKDMWQRPRVQQALKHDWFTSTSDAPLPGSILERLIQSGQEAVLRDLLGNALEERNTLADLRLLRAHLYRSARSGHVESSVFISVLSDYGDISAEAREYADLFSDAGWIPYEQVIDGTVKMKKERCEQMLYTLFSQLDESGEGYISEQDARELINVKECFSSLSQDDVDSIIDDMKSDHTNVITWHLFCDAILRDGRMDRRADCEADLEQSVCRKIRRSVGSDSCSFKACCIS